ncbi:unnamed protein product [Rotaria sp. Silwood1]|nr:unnamed protein product [Rotaria sp. Silwood1]CAF1603491.1 unnamed protein product [Rotaria sp. Silwood1]CAF4848213.1 unnamed protein product [Rotaria sp. Silwood1]
MFNHLFTVSILAFACQQFQPCHSEMLVYNQTLDHFNYDPLHRKFGQRYSIYDKFWGGCGDYPIFFNVGPETPLYELYFPGTNPYDLAVIFQAMIVSLEHRYYGESLPFGSNILNYTSNEFQYLSSKQYMEDIVEFRQFVINKYNCSTSKWISISGSYPGLISAYLRLHYPFYFIGAIAIASPVQIAKASTVSWLPNFASIIGPDCTVAWRSIAKQVEDLLVTSSGRDQLKQMFSYILSVNGIRENDELSWMEFLIDVASILFYPMGFNPTVGPTIFPRSYPGTYICQNISSSDSSMVLMNYATLGNETCVYQQSIGVPCPVPFAGSWYQWQRCTEFPSPYSPLLYDTNADIFSKYINLDNLFRSCHQTMGSGIGNLDDFISIGERWAGSASCNNNFDSYVNVGNFYFAVGTFDPTVTYLPTTNLSRTITGRIVPDTGHALLLNRLWYPNNSYVDQAFNELVEQIKIWLNINVTSTDPSYAARPGRPQTSVNEQTIDAVRTIINNDPHSTYQQIEDILGISSPAINSIIHDYLKLHKVCTLWVPHQLTDGQKQWSIQFCCRSLNRFEEGQSRRVFDTITGDESWFYHYDPATKEESKVWVSKTDPRPTKVHRNKSSGQIMVAVFFMKSGLIKSVPLETGVTLYARWYVNPCLPQVFKTVSKRRPRSGLRGLILHDDNARSHRAWIINNFLAKNRVGEFSARNVQH